MVSTGIQQGTAIVDVRIQQAVEQMRAVAAEAGQQAPAARAGEPEGAEFGEMLQSALGQVNDLQQASSQKTDAFLRGDDISLTEVMVASQKSRVGFEAVKEVRNRLLEAYSEISRMQV